MKAQEIRDLTDEEIRERLGEVDEELFRLRFRSATQQLESPALVRQLRRDRARLNTIARERALAAPAALAEEGK